MKEIVKNLLGMTGKPTEPTTNDHQEEKKFTIVVNEKSRFVTVCNGCISFRLMPSDSVTTFTENLSKQQIEIGRQIANLIEKPSKEAEKEMQMTFLIGNETVKIYPPKEMFSTLKKVGDISGYLTSIGFPTGKNKQKALQQHF